MPVLDLCRDGDDRAGRQADGGFALLLIPALACSADQNLAAAAFGVVDVPVVAAARLEGDVGQKHRALARFRQWVQIGIADEILGIPGIGLAQVLARYENVVYTEDMLSDAKADKKELTRLRKEIDDRRKEIKKAYLGPLQ